MDVLGISLLVLVLADDGRVHVTLSETESQADCEMSRTMVTDILQQAEINVITAMCGPTITRLTPFEHGRTPEEMVHRYRVTVAGQGDYQVEALPGDETCVAAQSASPAIYCAVSAQAPISQ
jgi:hypothetical protein